MRAGIAPVSMAGPPVRLHDHLPPQEVEEAPGTPVLDMTRRVAESGDVLQTGEVQDAPQRFAGDAHEQPVSADPAHGPQRRERLVQMLEHLAPDHQIEPPAQGLELVDRAGFEGDARVQPAGGFNHLGRQVGAEEPRVGEALDDHPGDESLPTTNLEDRGRVPSRREQVEHAAGEARHELPGNRIPRIVLVVDVSGDRGGARSAHGRRPIAPVSSPRKRFRWL